MRLHCLGLITAVALAACQDTTIPPAHADTKLASFLDSVATAATAAGQLARAAGVKLALRAVVDGVDPITLVFSSKSPLGDTYHALSWSMAKVVTEPSGADSIVDSVLVFTAWKDIPADTMIVAVVGDVQGIAPPIAPQLNVLGLDADTGGVQAVSIIGTKVVRADSGAVTAQFGAVGSPCVFTTIPSEGNDSNASQCAGALLEWQFGFRFPGLETLSLPNGGSPGPLVIR